MPYSCLLTPFPLRHQARKPEAPVRSSVSLKPTAPVRNTAIPERPIAPTRSNSATTTVSADVAVQVFIVVLVLGCASVIFGFGYLYRNHGIGTLGVA